MVGLNLARRDFYVFLSRWERVEARVTPEGPPGNSDSSTLVYKTPLVFIGAGTSVSPDGTDTI
jgi:hypothetical protein